MSKKHVIQAIATQCNTSLAEGERALEAVLAGMKAALEEHGEIRITGFGNFIVKERAARDNHHPQTGEPMVIPTKRVLKFKASPVLEGKLQ